MWGLEVLAEKSATAGGRHRPVTFASLQLSCPPDRAAHAVSAASDGSACSLSGQETRGWSHHHSGSVCPYLAFFFFFLQIFNMFANKMKKIIHCI
jgi:hypothetical protein